MDMKKVLKERIESMSVIDILEGNFNCTEEDEAEAKEKYRVTTEDIEKLMDDKKSDIPDFKRIREILRAMGESEIMLAIEFLKETEDKEEIYNHMRMLKEFSLMYHRLIGAYFKQEIIPKE